MAIAYRSLLAIPTYEELFEDVEREVRDWLAQRRRPLQLPDGQGLVTDDRTELSRVTWSDSTSRAVRWTLREVWEPPRWYEPKSNENRMGVTSITLVSAETRTWFWVDVDTPILHIRNRDGEESLRPQFSKTPRIVHKVLDTFEPLDGDLIVRRGPWIIDTRDGLGDLVNALEDDQRLCPIFVSAPLDQVQGQWLSLMTKLGEEVVGMASVAVIAPGILQDFNLRAGFKHSVQPGTMRTFLPSVEFGSTADSFRHKLLGRRQIADRSWTEIGSLLRGIVIQRARSLPVPQALRDTDYGLLRALRLLPLDTLRSASALEADLKLGTGEVEVLRLRLDRAQADMQEVERLASLYADQANQLVKENNGLREDVGFLGLELDEASSAISDMQSRVSWWRKQLLDEGLYEIAYSEIDEADRIVYPESFSELVERVSELEFVVCYDGRTTQRTASRLDEHSDVGGLVNRAWDTLVALEHYARRKAEGSFRGSLHEFINAGEYSIYGFKRNESETVLNNAKLVAQRRAKVPESVHPSGEVVMTMHVALTTGRAGSPRLYFYDNTASDGRVYVGYLGEHLQNTKTN